MIENVEEPLSEEFLEKLIRTYQEFGLLSWRAFLLRDIKKLNPRFLDINDILLDFGQNAWVYTESKELIEGIMNCGLSNICCIPDYLIYEMSIYTRFAFNPEIASIYSEKLPSPHIFKTSFKQDGKTYTKVIDEVHKDTINLINQALKDRNPNNPQIYNWDYGYVALTDEQFKILYENRFLHFWDNEYPEINKWRKQRKNLPF